MFLLINSSTPPSLCSLCVCVFAVNFPDFLPIYYGFFCAIFFLSLPILHSVLGTTTPQDPTAILSTRDINPIGEVSDIPHAVTE